MHFEPASRDWFCPHQHWSGISVLLQIVLTKYFVLEELAFFSVICGRTIRFSFSVLSFFQNTMKFTNALSGWKPLFLRYDSFSLKAAENFSKFRGTCNSQFLKNKNQRIPGLEIFQPLLHKLKVPQLYIPVGEVKRQLVNTWVNKAVMQVFTHCRWNMFLRT